MEQYIRISNINDFTYCPMSLYLHSVYESFDAKAYHQVPQIGGTIAHRSVDSGTYSTAKRFVTGLDVWSERFGLAGRIDVYDSKYKAIIERKKRIKTLFQGHRFQLYAQYFCMVEMGYAVERLYVHSLEDNKRYRVPLPAGKESQEFFNVLERMRDFDISKMVGHSCPKCAESIYAPLLWN